MTTLNNNMQVAQNISQDVKIILPPKREPLSASRLGTVRCREEHQSADVIGKSPGTVLTELFAESGKKGIENALKEIASDIFKNDPEKGIERTAQNLAMLQNNDFNPKEHKVLSMAAMMGGLNAGSAKSAITRQKTQSATAEGTAVTQDKPQQPVSAGTTQPAVPPVQEMVPQAIPEAQVEIQEPTSFTERVITHDVQNRAESIDNTDSNDGDILPPPLSSRPEVKNGGIYLTPKPSEHEYDEVAGDPLHVETQTDGVSTDVETQPDDISTKGKEHEHRSSDQKALLVGSLISLLTGIISLSVGLVEKGESSSNTDIPEDQIEQADADLSAQIDTLQTNASLEEQLSETLDKVATACNNDAAEMQQLAQGLADNLDQMVNEGSTLIYNAALEQAESQAFNDPENQAMTTDEYGNLVPTGELTDAAKASCEAQAEAVKEQAVEEMTTAINTVIDNINEKADALSQLSVKTASASDELSTLSQSSLSTADTLKSVQKTFEEMKNAQIDQLNTGLSQAGFDGTMVAGSVALTLAAGLIAKYGLNRHHNGLNKQTTTVLPTAEELRVHSGMNDAASVATGADAIDPQRVAEIQARPLPEIPFSESVDNSELYNVDNSELYNLSNTESRDGGYDADYNPYENI
ncbi:Tir intimin-binding domain-containing protein [Citrobacter sp. ANG330]|uniref:Tir intimin-binding domain-containing protein n=1 Tax=Citrobacter sp. ANG330 TaxID=3048142 RepID=UPI0039C00689